MSWRHQQVEAAWWAPQQQTSQTPTKPSNAAVYIALPALRSASQTKKAKAGHVYAAARPSKNADHGPETSSKNHAAQRKVGMPSASTPPLTRTDTTNGPSAGVAIANTVLALATGSALHAETRMGSTVPVQVEDHPSSGIPDRVDQTTDSIPGMLLLYPEETSGAAQPTNGASLNQNTAEENESMPIDPLLLQLDASATPQQDQVRYTS